MKFDLISFDLQGTLSDSAFSDEFWLELLPRLHSEKYGTALEDSRAALRTQFAEMGKYDFRYYSAEFWLEQLCPDTNLAAVVDRLVKCPSLYLDLMDVVEELKPNIPLAIISTTTRSFIELELGSEARHFKHIYSSLDDLEIPGKPPGVFREVARRLDLDSARILHIGDCPEMDVTNALAAGWQVFHFDKKQPRKDLIGSLRRQLELD